jgi:TIGR03009 family protein
MLFAQQAKRPEPSARDNQPAGKATLSSPAVPNKSAADSSQPRPTAEKRPRPAPQEMEKEPEVDKLDPKLERILIDWEAHSSKIKSLHGKHTRKEFIKTFAVEKVSEGEFFLETPDKGRIDMIAKPVAKGAVASRKDYALEKGSSERWICTGEEILSFNEDDKTYIREVLPVAMRGKNIVHSPLPFLFGMKADEAKQRFNLKIVSFSKDNTTVQIQAIPRMDSDRQNYSEAGIVLDLKRFVPNAVRLFDPNGIETVYIFNSVEINDGGFLAKIKSKFSDPYHPSVKGYTLQISNDVQPASNTEPAGSKPGNRGSQANPLGNPAGRGTTTKPDADEIQVERPKTTRTSSANPPSSKR